jgi:transmembrane sensor
MSEIGMELLERYLIGQTNPEECERVEAWLAEDPERWAQFAALRDGIVKRDLSDRAVQDALTEVWARLAAEVGSTDARSVRFPTRPERGTREFAAPRSQPKLVRWLVAAMIILTIGGGLLATLMLRRTVPSAQPTRIASTAPGERASFLLPDGTQVMLGVASTLWFPEAFPRESREVTLQGEAYFDVVHDLARPFAVRAGGLVARDLGTRFTVRAYPEDPSAQVVVRQGKVAIRALANGPSQVVSPGELGRLADGKVPTVEPADTAVWFAWTEGRLVFEETPLREALPQLSRWFNLEFRLDDSTLGAVPLTATFRTQPTAEALNSLAASLGMRQRRAGRVVTLYSTKPGR